VLSFKKRNVLLIVFVVFTFLFGSLFAYEFFQVQQLKSLTQSTTVTTETLFTTSTITVTTNSTTKPNTVPGTVIPKSYFRIFLSESSVQAIQGENKILCSVSAAAYKVQRYRPRDCYYDVE
jgi:hypothetical protein